MKFQLFVDKSCLIKVFNHKGLQVRTKEMKHIFLTDSAFRER